MTNAQPDEGPKLAGSESWLSRAIGKVGGVVVALGSLALAADVTINRWDSLAGHICSMTSVCSSYSMEATSMASAMDAARTAGQSAAEFESCGVNAADFLALVLRRGRECKASKSQLSSLQVAYEAEVRIRTQFLERQGYRCTWSLKEAKAHFDEAHFKLRADLGAGC